MTFTIKCELPTQSGVFASSPNARGTLKIVWRCLSILVLCTWSVLHLNVPLQRTCRTRRQQCLYSAHNVLRKAAWMLFNLMAPEWTVDKAYDDLCAMLATHREFEQHKAETNSERDVPWTRMHTSFANMGGFTVVFAPEATDATEEPEEAGGPRAE